MQEVVRREANLKFTHLVGRSWRAFKAQTWPLVHVLLIYIIISILGGLAFFGIMILGGAPLESGQQQLPSPLAYYIYVPFALLMGLITVMYVGMNMTALEIVRNNIVNWKMAFIGFKKFWKLQLVVLMFFIGMGLTFPLLVIPGLIFVLASWPVVFVAMETNEYPWRCFQHSWRITWGRRWRLFFTFLIYLLLIIVASLLAFVPPLMGEAGLIPPAVASFSSIALNFFTNIAANLLGALFVATAYDELVQARGLEPEEPRPEVEAA